MRYNDTRNAIVGGTRLFDIPGRYLDLSTAHESADENRAATSLSRDNNGRSKMFIITIDPQGLYTLGVSAFTLSDIVAGLLDGNVFAEGTEFMSPTGRVRIMGGRLKYTKNKALYKLPEMRL